MAKTEKRRIGDVGEEIACKYLVKQGYSVLERNYWRPWGEIDIVCRKGDTLHFVEVKSVSREASRQGVEAIRPEENMHPAKLRRLHRAVQSYLLERGVGESMAFQIDLACVYLDFEAKKAKVELLENVVL